MTTEMVQWLVDGKFQNEMVLQDRRIYVFTKGRQKLANIDPMLCSAPASSHFHPQRSNRKLGASTRVQREFKYLMRLI